MKHFPRVYRAIGPGPPPAAAGKSVNPRGNAHVLLISKNKLRFFSYFLQGRSGLTILFLKYGSLGRMIPRKIDKNVEQKRRCSFDLCEVAAVSRSSYSKSTNWIPVLFLEGFFQPGIPIKGPR